MAANRSVHRTTTRTAADQASLRDRLHRQFGWMTPLRHTSPSGERVLAADAGFVLLEVLFGLALFMLIVVYALQNFGGLRQRTYAGAATNDAEQVAVATENWLTDNPGGDPSVAANTTAILASVNFTSGDSLGWTGAMKFDGATGQYAFCINHATGGSGDAAALYQSALGRVTANRKGSGCAAAAPATGATATTLAGVGTW